MERLGRLGVVMLAVVLLLSACKTGRGVDARRDVSDRQLRQEHPILEWAIPSRALLVAKASVERLTAVPGTVLEDRSRGRSVVHGGLDLLIDARGFSGRRLKERIEAPTPKWVEALDADRPIYLAVSEPREARVWGLLRYGGLLSAVDRVRNRPRLRLTLPTEDPDALVEALKKSREASEAGGSVDYRTVDGYVVVQIRMPEFPEGSAAAERDGDGAGGAAFGLPGPTPALRAWAGHDDGVGVYATFDGVRRLSALVGLGEVEAALEAVSRSDVAAMSMRGVAYALQALATSGDGATEFVDVAVLGHGGQTGEEGQEGDASGFVDVVRSPTDLGRAGLSEQPGRWSVPEIEVDKPVVQMVWPGPQSASGEAPQSWMMEMIAEHGVPGFLGEQWRAGGVWSLATTVAGFMEGPSGWTRVVRDRLRETLKRGGVDAGKAEAFVFPEVVAASVSWQPKHGNANQLRRLSGGVALGWSAEAAPKWIEDWLPSPGLEFRWSETEGRAFLLIAREGRVDRVFPNPRKLQPSQPGVTIDLQPVVASLQRVPQMYLEQLIDRMGGITRFHVTAENGAAGRVWRYQLGGAQRARPPEELMTTRGRTPEASGLAWRRCRTRHVVTVRDMTRSLESVAPTLSGKFFDTGRSEAKELLESCQSDYPAHEKGFRQAMASWLTWMGDSHVNASNFRTAAHFWRRACEAGDQAACQRRVRLGGLEGWAHLPYGDPKVLRLSSVPDGWGGQRSVWTLRLARDGSVQARSALEEGVEASKVGGFVDTFREKLEAETFRTPASLVVAPDFLAPSSHLRPLLRLARGEAETYLSMAISNDRVFRRNTAFPSTRYMRLGREVGEEKSDAVIRLRRDGIGLEFPTLEPTDPEGPKRCGEAAPTFCLLDGLSAIDGRVKAVREALGSGDGAAKKAYGALLDAYPLHEVYGMVMAAAKQAGGFDGPVEIRVAADVPVGVVPQLVGALLVEREVESPDSLEALREAEAKSEVQRGRKMSVRLFDGFRIVVERQAD